MGIRRKPRMEERLSKAIQKYHEHGPILVVELEDELERLRDQVDRLKVHVAQRDSAPVDQKAAETPPVLRPQPETCKQTVGAQLGKTVEIPIQKAAVMRKRSRGAKLVEALRS